MDMLSIENLIDIREAVMRRLHGLHDLDEYASPKMENEKQRRIKSLSDGFAIIEQRIKDLQFEAERELGHKPADDVYRCDVCKWTGKENRLIKVHSTLQCCPVCNSRNVHKI